MASSLPHTFDGRSWRIIKEFTGIYGVKMNYTKITKLSRDKLSKAYFEHAKLPIEPFEVLIVYRAKYNQNGKIISLAPDTPSETRPFDKGCDEWKSLILKKAAQGYKNRQFYEALAKMVAPPEKISCVCGLKIGPNIDQQQAHYRTRNHINRMLKCVPASKVADSNVPAWQRRNILGNSHTLVVRKWSNQQRQFLVKQIDYRSYMEQREELDKYIVDELKPIKVTEKMKKDLKKKWGYEEYTMDDLLTGGWAVGW
jgi:hypothetical protein